MSENVKFEEREKRIVTTLNTMFDYLGLSADLRVEEKGTRIGVKINSEDAGRIIGRKGQTLESLQLLLNRIMFKDDKDFPHVMLDIDGYARGERGTRPDFDGDDDDRAGRSEERRERPSRERRERRPRGEERESTKEQLELQALDAAKEVKRWGEPVTLPEMNAHDRRIIHVTLKEDSELTTESLGEGAYKKVVISLKKEA
ncbi:MAG: KH domain-containing protein [Victivallales bacterium]|jgi:spoIIIJ-associated protein|nr:KH domain-containing protein [Victivallales bacterium]